MSFFDQAIGWVLALYAFLGPPVFLIIGWTTVSRGLFQPRWRAWIGVACLAALTLQAAAYLLAFLHLGKISGFGNAVDFWLRWSSWNARISLAIIGFAFLGKGLSRVCSILCAFALICFAIEVDMMR